jgi:hypothetical protein
MKTLDPLAMEALFAYLFFAGTDFSFGIDEE